MAPSHVRGIPGSRGHQNERVENLGIQSGDVPKHFMAALDGIGEPLANGRIGVDVLAEMRHPNATCRASSCAASRLTAAVTGSGAKRSINQSSDRNVPSPSTDSRNDAIVERPALPRWTFRIRGA